MSEEIKAIKKLNDQGCGDLDLGLSILGNDEGVSIRIYDQDAGIEFLEIELTPADFLALTLGRNAQRRVVGNFRSVHRIGKTMEVDDCTFPMPGIPIPGFPMPENTSYSKREVIAYEQAKQHCPVGWFPDKYFGSRGAFFMKKKLGDTSEQESWARATIRRWVEKE